MFSSWPIASHTLTPCATGAVVWHRGGRLHVTIVVKATFRLVADGAAALASPIALVERERHYEKSAARSLEAASEIAPFMPQADVLLQGSAVPQATSPGTAYVRLALRREGVLLDKTLVVHGESAGGAPRPFTSIPLLWERAHGGAGNDHNPVGVGEISGIPNIVDPADPKRPSGFGPIAWNWPPRLSRIAGVERQQIFAAVADYPDDFDFGFFQTAPADQRIQYLAGDERILLEGLSPEWRRLQTRLPGARALARAFMMTREGPTALQDVPLVADMLVIDADHEHASLIWRGHRPFAHAEADLAHLGVIAGVELVDAPVRWPSDVAAAVGLSPAKGAPIPAASAVFAGESGLVALAPAAEATAEPQRIAHLPFVRAKADAPPPERAVMPSDFLRSGKKRAGSDDDSTKLVNIEELARQRTRSATALPFAAKQRGDISLVPRREGDAIPFVAAAPYDVGTHHWQVNPPQNLLIVMVKGTYDIVHGEPVRPRARPDFITGERFYQDNPEGSAVGCDEIAIFKPKADVLMVGHAYAPKKGAVAGQVSFAFGSEGNRFERKIAVFGERVWQRGMTTLAGDPYPFEKIPLVYEHAYGGPGLETNPAGRGHGESHLMPNLELPGKFVTSPDDKRPPACFAPIAMQWASRWAQQGTYDKKWFNTRWPYFPADFDWNFFQAAPEEQRLEYLRGDESFEAKGVHPELPSVRGALAGERARAFVVTRDDPPVLREVLLYLDTVAFDFDQMKVDVIWRGLFHVSADDAPEVRALFAMRQGLGEPERSVEEAFNLLLETLVPPTPEEEDAAEPTPPRSPIDERAEAERLAKLKEVEENAAKLEADLDERVKKAMPPGFGEEEPPVPDPTLLAETLAADGATKDEVDAILRALKGEEDEEPPAPEAEPPPSLRERVLQMLQEGASFEAFDFEAGDFSDLDFSGRVLSGAQLQRAVFARASFAGAKLAGAQLEAGDFSDACFDGADLTSADLLRAKLERASFQKAILAHAELSEAQAREADFTGARGEGIAFTDGDWTRCRFDGAEMEAASFSGAKIGGASFVGAKLAKIVLRDAVGPDVRFDRAIMTAVRGEGCKLHRSSWRWVEAPNSVLENAELLEADLRCALLSGSSFVRAKCLKANFGQAELVESRMMRAKLTGAVFEKANLMGSRLDRADLGIADLRGANLHACSLVNANLLDAKMTGAITTKSSLVMKPFK